MSPQQFRVSTLLIIAVGLCAVGVALGRRTTRHAGIAMIVCWLVVASTELALGPNFPVAFVGDALYALAMLGIGVRDRVMWPVYLIGGEAMALIWMFLLTDLTNSDPIVQIIGYNALVMSGPVFVAGLAVAERFWRRRDGGGGRAPWWFKPAPRLASRP